MPLEKEQIIDELKKEGISEILGNGLTFETTEELSGWVNAYKTGLPKPEKKLTEYTKEELEELSKDPEFKGAKGLQGFIDSIRQKTVKKDQPPQQPKTDDEPPEWAKKLEARFNEIETKHKTESFNQKVDRIAKSKGIDDAEFINEFIKPKLALDSDDSDVESAIEKAKNFLIKKNLMAMGSPGGGSRSYSQKPKNAISAKFVEKEKAKKIKK